MKAIRPTTTVDRWSGVAYVVLAVASSATVSLPLSSDPPARISALYAEHRTAYVLAQVVGLLGVLAFVGFLVALRKYDETIDLRSTVAGALVALAAVGTNISVLVLCFDTGLTPTGVHRAALFTDITDDILFAAYAVMALFLALASLPPWQRTLAAAASALSLLQAASAWLTVPGLNIVAPSPCS